MGKQEGTLKEHAIWLHELFQSLKEAGFDEEVSLTLISEKLPDFPGEAS